MAGLGTARDSRRLGASENAAPPNIKKIETDAYRRGLAAGMAREKKQQEERKMTPNSVIVNPEVERAAKVLADRTKEDVKNQISLLYSDGKTKLSPVEQAAVALVTYNMGLDPSPGVGHLYAWRDGKGFHVQIGYQGWLFKARQQTDFVHVTRPMTPTEATSYGVAAGHVGFICELYDKNQAKMWQSMNLPPRPIIGIGTVKPDHTPPNGRPLGWVARKRSIVDAVRQIGIGFGPMDVKPVEGMVYDREQDQYFMPIEDAAPDDDAIEGEYDEMPDAENDPPDAESDPTQFYDPTRPYDPEMLKIKLDALANTGDMTPLSDSDDFLSNFAGYCSAVDAPRFVLWLTGADSMAKVTQVQANIIVSKILVETEHAKAEIAAVLKMLGDAPKPPKKSRFGKTKAEDTPEDDSEEEEKAA